MRSSLINSHCSGGLIRLGLRPTVLDPITAQCLNNTYSDTSPGTPGPGTPETPGAPESDWTPENSGPVLL